MPLIGHMIMKRAELHDASGGFALLSETYRPFFLLAGLWGGISMIFWILIVTQILEISSVMADEIWHQHEMVFGFTAAAIAGFSLTALPSWSKRPRISGAKLGVLAVVWMLGRLVFLVPDSVGSLSVMIIDMAFLSILSLIACYYILGGKNWKNSPILILIIAFAVGNALVHLELVELYETAALGFQIAILSVVMLIAVIGGRVTPAFTRNWLVRKGSQVEIADPMQIFDVIALLSLVIFTFSFLIFGNVLETAITAVIAAFINLIRLLRWKFWAVLSEPIMWVLHLGYLWLIIGLAMIGLSYAWEGVSSSVAMHSFTVGGFGTFIFAMMTRATLGHSGREIKASMLTTMIYFFITASAILRISSSLIDGYSDLALKGAGLCWIFAFILFCIEYIPIFTRPRIESQSS